MSSVGEKATYVEYLAQYRQTLLRKCEDLSPEQLALRSVPPSTLSLLGLVRHMAYVEHTWFVRVGQQSSEAPLFLKEQDSDADFNDAVGTQECVDEAFAALRTQVERAEQWLDGIDEADFGRELPHHRSGTVEIRDLLVHMIEEYARHCGHADLLRECIDGRTGE
ncbi:DinB family protein [Aeromicrobium tamlense]|uniref:Damage-inducible protein DinB n=1 Tax=Aeromicrobium tamlense TaxID=375541 RepID=A0A8I0FWT7_9ACTN|nr:MULTISPECIES: DinB family protein [Aeromicrobium]MBD1270391.1 DinB family protein [Aeromicrobium tamlense]MBD1271477.1 DinB family protein [Aeromicrobium tamlense]NYI37778.1 putative damage-inducible protein DinB [Aeromicrobium tamlense]